MVYVWSIAVLYSFSDNLLAAGGYEERYPWTELFGEFGFVLDGLASPFAILIKPYMILLETNSQSGTYYALFLVFAMGMLGTILHKPD